MRSSTSAGSRRDLTVLLNAHGMNRGVKIDDFEALDSMEMLLLEDDLPTDSLLLRFMLSLLGGRGIGR